MATTIVTKYGSGAPTASDLVEGELAVDTTNGRLYTENSSAAVVELGSNPSGNITFGDNGKAIFGAGSDLQIYHNGSTSVIEDSGTGNLQIRTSTLAVVNAAGTEVIMQGVEDGAVSLYHNAGVKLATTATGIDVTGTVVSDGLTVDGNNDIQINRDGVSSAKVFWNRGVTQDAAIELDASESLTISVDDAGLTGKSLVLKNNSKVGFALADGGDISFYEDTGTTAKFFWDSSAESLGIGTSSPSKKLVISDGGAMGVEISPDDSGSGYSRIINYDRTTNQYEPLRIEGKILQFSTGTTATEKARLDASGNLLVGKTAQNLATEGITISPTGYIQVTENQSPSLYLNRLTTDGSIINFYKDGTTIGSIGSKDGDIAVGTGDTGFRFIDGSNAISPHNISTNAGRDAAIDLGTSGGRFKDLYLSGSITSGANGGLIKEIGGDTSIVQGAIGLRINDFASALSPTTGTANNDGNVDLGLSNVRFKDLYRSGSTYSTSDRNMKQDIRDLTDAERNVAVACKGLLKAFRFIDAVEKDGDDANIHFGVIAQELAEAFEAEGLDANDYQVYKSATTTDEDGNEQTRLNVCYENLLAFIIAAI